MLSSEKRKLYVEVIHELMLSVHSSIQAMASSEDRAYEIMRELDVNYVLVIFGGLTGYASDGEFITHCCNL